MCAVHDVGSRTQRGRVLTHSCDNVEFATGEIVIFVFSIYIITGEDFDPSKDRGRRPEARHVLPGNELDHTERRDVGMHADAAGGRLRDWTARVFCTPQQMPQNFYFR